MKYLGSLQASRMSSKHVFYTVGRIFNGCIQYATLDSSSCVIDYHDVSTSTCTTLWHQDVLNLIRFRRKMHAIELNIFEYESGIDVTDIFNVFYE